MDTEKQASRLLIDGLRVNKAGVYEFLWINPGEQAGESVFDDGSPPRYDGDQIGSLSIQPEEQHQVASSSMSGYASIRVVHPPFCT